MSDEEVVVKVGGRGPAYYYEKTVLRALDNGVRSITFLARGRNISSAVVAANRCSEKLGMKISEIQVWSEPLMREDGRELKSTCIRLTLVKEGE